MPPHNPRPDQDYAAHSSWSPPALRVYPEPSSIPPHWHAHPPNPSQYRDPRPYVSPPPTQPNPRVPWQTVNPYARVLQVQPFTSPPPPPIPHKVWILDCKACSMFLTNRGMKVSESSHPQILPIFRAPSPSGLLRHTRKASGFVLLPGFLQCPSSLILWDHDRSAPMITYEFRTVPARNTHLLASSPLSQRVHNNTNGQISDNMMVIAGRPTIF